MTGPKEFLAGPLHGGQVDHQRPVGHGMAGRGVPAAADADRQALWSRAKRTAVATSLVPLARAISAGWRSIAPFHTWRAASYPLSPGEISFPSKSVCNWSVAGPGHLYPGRPDGNGQVDRPLVRGAGPARSPRRRAQGFGPGRALQVLDVGTVFSAAEARAGCPAPNPRI